MNSMCLKENVRLHNPNWLASRNSQPTGQLARWTTLSHTIIKDYTGVHHFMVNDYFRLQFIFIIFFRLITLVLSSNSSSAGHRQRQELSPSFLVIKENTP